MKVKTKILTGVVAFILSIVLLFTMVSINGKAGKSVEVSASTRTVSLEQNRFDDQSLWSDFDESNMQTNDDGFDLVAWKSFDKSIFNELDLVGLDETGDEFTVRYEITYIDSDDTILLTVTMEGDEEISVIDTIPGLISFNPAGDADVMFVVDGEYIWLSELYEDGQLDNVGWFSKLIKKAAKAITNAVFNLITRPFAAGVTKLAVKLLGNKAASYGAEFLDMSEELDQNKKPTGIYHADFDCWQDKFGYMNLYDFIFDMFTYMEFGKFPFDVNGDDINDFVIWAWKGNYLNLGAGAELGVYKKWEYGNDIWVVDKNFAMTMSLKLEYNKKSIINWAPKEQQWWITGFNSNTQYLEVRPNQLTATFELTFDMVGNKSYSALDLYGSFKNSINGKDSRWSFSKNFSDMTAKFEL